MDKTRNALVTLITAGFLGNVILLMIISNAVDHSIGEIFNDLLRTKSGYADTTSGD